LAPRSSGAWRRALRCWCAPSDSASTTTSPPSTAPSRTGSSAPSTRPRRAAPARRWWAAPASASRTRRVRTSTAPPGARWDWRPRSYSTFSVSTGGEADETNGFGDFILRRDVTFGWSHDWSARLRSNVDAGFARESQRPTDRVDRVRYAGIGADYALRRWLRAGASWRWYERASNVEAFDYERNVVLFSLEANL